MDRTLPAGTRLTGSAVTGRLQLTAASIGGRTVLTEVYRTPPFHPGPLIHRGGVAEVILQSVGPGVMPGDQMNADVTVERDAALVVSAQGATKVYPAPTGDICKSNVTLRVASGGTLWWLPGELIPFRDARYAARTEVVLEPGARFALIEIITPGRLATGERFAYRELDLRLRIDMAGKPILIERALLDPVNRSLAVAGSTGELSCSGTLVLVGYAPLPDVGWDGDDVWIGGDGHCGLFVVRALARPAALLRQALLGVLQRADDRQG